MSHDTFSAFLTLPVADVPTRVPVWIRGPLPSVLDDAVATADAVAHSDGDELYSELRLLIRALRITTLDVLLCDPDGPALAQARQARGSGYLVAALLPQDIEPAQVAIDAMLADGDALDAATGRSGNAELIAAELECTQEDAFEWTSSGPFWVLHRARLAMARAREQGRAFVHVRMI